MAARSTLSCEIDLEAPGKRHGFLRLPHSTHESAYGFIPIPIAVIANGRGPTVLLLAGNHGDEYEGQIALGRLIREVEPAQLATVDLVAAMFDYAADQERIPDPARPLMWRLQLPAITLACLDPGSNTLYELRASGFVTHTPEHALAVVAGESAAWYQGKRGFLAPVAIVREAAVAHERGAQA